MTTKLVDTATIADWNFLTDPHDEYEAWRRQMVEGLWNEGEPLDWGVTIPTMEAIATVTDYVASKHDVPAQDLFQDTVLHMAVRPARTETLEDTLAYTRGVAMNLAKPPQRIAQREQSLDNLQAQAEEGSWE